MIRQQRLRLELPAVLSLGSNLGDREATLRTAVADIVALDGVTHVAASGIVESAAVKPHGTDTDAPAYLNAVVTLRTVLAPEALLAALAGIEQAHGRERHERWGDRTLDIDIVAMGGLVLDTDKLTLPHPRAADRAFVLAPWLQLDPNAHLPVYGRADELLARLSDGVASYPAEALL
ncbi:MAG TPA: 2-amino-4-hydroxy-6-hydroxymethyldihydropteridine diphosphokinase [Glaciihabitans sp.]|jgi:2-amino-4-hydroxy-6-hydroxymethyldihydropteridine diphosphokinase|nr:2-amino-4-hydroxy-6-hydroxymethyldihydropteridine diphosphokinase [Glaciihabitans sp.]